MREHALKRWALLVQYLDVEERFHFRHSLLRKDVKKFFAVIRVLADNANLQNLMSRVLMISMGLSIRKNLFLLLVTSNHALPSSSSEYIPRYPCMTWWWLRLDLAAHAYITRILHYRNRQDIIGYSTNSRSIGCVCSTHRRIYVS